MDSIIDKLQPIGIEESVNETPESLNKTRFFIDDTAKLFGTLNSTDGYTQALSNYLTNTQKMKDIPKQVLLKAKCSLNDFIESRITTPESKTDLLKRIEGVFTPDILKAGGLLIIFHQLSFFIIVCQLIVNVLALMK